MTEQAAASKTLAPYKIFKEGGKWVVKNNGGETKVSFPGDDDGKAKALKYLRALYANVKGAPDQADKKKWSGKQKRPVTVKAASITVDPHDFEPSVVMPTFCEDCSLEEPAICHHGETLTIDGAQDDKINNTDGAVQPRNGDDLVVHLASYDSHPLLASPNDGHCLACGGSPEHPLHQLAADDLNHKKKSKHRFQRPAKESTTGWFGGMPMCGICGRPEDDPNHSDNDGDEPAAGTGTGGETGGTTAGQDGTAQVSASFVDELENMVVRAKALMANGNPGSGYYGDELLRDVATMLDLPELAAASSVSADERRKMAKSGVAMDDGSFPIPDVAHLKSAIRLARTPAQRAHVMKRARALGKADMIPDNWGKGGDRQAAFLTEMNGKTLITGTAEVMRQLAIRHPANGHMLGIVGRFVGGEVANRNGALWTTADLEMGVPSVVSGPLNWLHEARHVIGSITKAQLVQRDEQVAEDLSQPYIAAASVIWKWLWPDEAAVVQMASESNSLWYSMECVSENVLCAGDNGCGKSVPYSQFIQAAGLCEHMSQRSATRRFENPTFLGGAVIVPPVRPGWADAYASVMPQAAAMAEKAYEQAGEPDVSASDWEMLMAQVVSFAQT